MIKLFKNLAISLIMLTSLGNICFAEETTDQVKSFIEDLCNKTIIIVKDKQMSDDEKTTKLSGLFVQTVDVEWIGKFALGRYYKTLSEQEQSNYDKIFSKFLINSYVPKFKQYTTESVKVISVTKQSENEYLAKTEIIRPGKESLKVNYMVRDNGSNILSIFDVIAEGISLINTKRAEFDSIVSSSDTHNLITMLENKVK